MSSAEATGLAATLTTPRAGTTAQTLRTLQAAGKLLTSQDPAVVQQTAAQFASELFFAPLLAEVRQSPLGAEFMDGGRTESVFGAQLDQRIADVVAATAPGLTQRIVREFARATPGGDAANWPVQQQLRKGAA
jgi:hypothetical protein